MHWTGYMVHFTESCEADELHLVLHADTTPADVHEARRTQVIHSALAAKDLTPSEHLVDAASVSAPHLTHARDQHGIDLIGPGRRNTSWQGGTADALTPADFVINWSTRQARCPEGHTSRYWALYKLRVLRIAGWMCVCVLVVLSWIPREWEARTGLPRLIEHAIAYFGTAGIFAFAYQDPRRWRLIAGFVVLAGVLEAGQLWVPGRSSQVAAFAASSIGAIAGVLIGRAAIVWLVGFVMRPQQRYYPMALQLGRNRMR